MRIDAVDKIELLVELFERHAEAKDDKACPFPTNSQFMSVPCESRSETTTLAEMLAEAPSILEVFSHNWHRRNDLRHVPIDRLVRFLAENAESIERDTPRSAKLLHYVYPIV
ncbi:hypothetical protein [uncultured Bradyrhizobium sp.]|uniref:hypothetical protein n=1 Tax=uncultured Bradyrhizobium sp. TaxID=199684 RepID=UPI0035CC3EDF